MIWILNEMVPSNDTCCFSLNYFNFLFFFNQFVSNFLFLMKWILNQLNSHRTCVYTAIDDFNKCSFTSNELIASLSFECQVFFLILLIDFASSFQSSFERKTGESDTWPTETFQTYYRWFCVWASKLSIRKWIGRKLRILQQKRGTDSFLPTLKKWKGKKILLKKKKRKIIAHNPWLLKIRTIIHNFQHFLSLVKFNGLNWWYSIVIFINY